MYQKIIERLCPAGTRRHHCYTILAKATRRLRANEGLGSFLTRLKRIYALRKVRYALSHDTSIYLNLISATDEQAVDIIVPVYNAFEITRDCLSAVFSFTVDIPYRVIVIDDASTEPELRDYFDYLSSCQGNVIVVRNEENSGFAKSVNRGLRLAKGDVVILNSDTVVTFDWLRKLKACAYSNEKIATVTPLSNNAETCSVPEFCKNNALPRGYTIESFASLVAKSALDVKLAYHELPVGLGFCMYIKRQIINEVGLLDEVFGRGYGEEIDFCLRASSRGYYHVVCPFVFVWHVGSASFVRKLTELERKNVAILLERYPDYRELISSFIIRNPLLPLHKSIRKNLNK